MPKYKAVTLFGIEIGAGLLPRKKGVKILVPLKKTPANGLN
jgi:hypothetical protein